MVKKITRAMILAAGLGTRLRPITYKTPKPMIEISERPIIEYNLLLLIKSGITDVVINLHHLGDQIKNRIGDGSRFGVNITYSPEPEILGTAGGIKRVEDFFGKDDFVVINGDILTDVNLPEVIGFHFSEGVDLTLVTRAIEPEQTHTPLTTRDKRLIELGNGDMIYTGVQVLNPSILKLIPKDRFSETVEVVYRPMLSENRPIATYIHEGYWNDLGTKERIESTREDIEGKGVKFWYL